MHNLQEVYKWVGEGTDSLNQDNKMLQCIHGKAKVTKH